MVSFYVDDASIIEFEDAGPATQQAFRSLIAQLRLPDGEPTVVGRFDGLKYLYQELGLTGADAQTQEYKASLDYLRTLLKHDDVNLHVNYNTKIATFDD